MFELTTEESQPGRFTRHKIICDESTMSFDAVLESWVNDETFRTFFSNALSGSSFAGFRWETPPLITATISNAFEFVLVNSPGFCKRRTDSVTFQEKFRDAKREDVITFANIGGDATMIVPTPKSDDTAYGHLAAFVRNAHSRQTNSLWRVVGKTVRDQTSNDPIWLSTAGGGVAWLHVRVDSTPKYYAHAPYRTPQ
jgi:hypothetical protein